MSTPEVLAADQDGDNFLTKVENAVEFSADSLQVITPPESVKLRWKIGDIVWSKIPGHPWWPSLIAYEPNTEVYFKMKGRTRYYHVQFFGTEPLRGWVTERNILKYEGKTHFLSLRLSIHGKPHKIGTKQLPTWEKAIKMADETIPLDHQERQVCFNFFNVIETPSPAIEGKGDESLNSSKEWSSSPQTHSKEVSSPEGPPTKKTKVENGKQQSKTQGKNKRNSVKQRTPKRTSKTPPGKHVNNKLPEQMNNNLEKQVRKEGGFYVVEPSPTSCAFDMNTKPITPENGKRKRGRPRKDSVLVVGSKEDQQTVSPAKKTTNGKSLTKISALPNNLSSTSAESEKSDGASDTNSTSSIDTEIRRIVLKNKDICTVCEKPDNLLTCEGVCNSSYHKDCLKSEVPSEKFICEKCSTGNHTCFICNKTDNVIKCSFQNCGKFYHLDCIKTLDSKINGDSFVCPLHHCNVCGVSKSSNSKKRLTCCVRCPVAYHTGTCIVAGSMPITLQYLVCNRHFSADPKKAHHSHVNVNWCFVCSIGGTLICCESCPAAFHPECIEVTGIPEGHFFCRDCKDGKELLYGEIVWVKLGMYRWWPAQICNPNNIPNNIQRMKHQAGEFPVQFLGSHDYYWIHRGRVFSYQEGDKGSIGGGGKYLGEIFKKALVEAQDKYAEWLKIQEEKAEKDLEKLSKKPAAYKHIKVNRYTTATKYEIDESELSTCDCSINDENPCGPDSHCLNRILYVECSPLKCPAKEKCQNQCFVKRQHLSAEPFRALGRGWGLRAKADAKKGQFVNEYVGELINEETCRERVRKGINEGVVNYYMLTIDKDCIIDAGPMGNLSRFMNHSCDPNCETQKWTVNGEVRVGLFAKRDIKAGEELVFDYQLDCLGNEKKKCSCGSKNCSGFLGVRPKTQHALKLQEEKKKSHESKKRKKKTGTKKNIDGARVKPQAHGLVPEDLGSSEFEDLKHFDKTPEAFQASKLESDEHKTAIERVLVCNNDKQFTNIHLKTPKQTIFKRDVESLSEYCDCEPNTTSSDSVFLNEMIPQTSSISANDQIDSEEGRSVNETAGVTSNPTRSHSSPNLATSIPDSCDVIPSVESLFNSQCNQKALLQTNAVSGFWNSLDPVPSPEPSISPLSCTTTNSIQGNLASNFTSHGNPSVTKLPSLSYDVPTSQVQRSFQNTTLSQFTPKDTSVVTHAFHNLGPNFSNTRNGTPSTPKTRDMSSPRVSTPRVLGEESDASL